MPIKTVIFSIEKRGYGVRIARRLIAAHHSARALARYDTQSPSQVGGCVRANFNRRGLRGSGKLLVYSHYNSLFQSPSQCEETAMESAVGVSPQEFAESMKTDIDEFAQEVIEAVGNSGVGQWIVGSEMPVRDLCAAMRQKTLERAVPCAFALHLRSRFHVDCVNGKT